MRSVLCLGRRGTDTSIASPRPNNIFICAKIPPICNSFLPASLPLLLCQNFKLFDHFLGLYLIQPPSVIGLLHFSDMFLLGLDFPEQNLTIFVVLLMESGIRQGKLTFFGSGLILLLSLELSLLTSLSHDSQINFSFLRFSQSLMSFLYSIKGSLCSRIFAPVRMQNNRISSILFVDVII